MALIKTSVFTYANSLSTHPTIHAIRYFLVEIICGPYRGSFPVQDHLRSNLGIICGPGSIAVLGSLADPYKSVNARIAGWKLTTSVRMIFFSIHEFIHEPYNILDRSVVTGKFQTLAYRIDLAIARSIRQGLSLRFSRNDLTLGY